MVKQQTWSRGNWGSEVCGFSQGHAGTRDGGADTPGRADVTPTWLPCAGFDLGTFPTISIYGPKDQYLWPKFFKGVTGSQSELRSGQIKPQALRRKSLWPLSRFPNNREAYDSIQGRATAERVGGQHRGAGRTLAGHMGPDAQPEPWPSRV